MSVTQITAAGITRITGINERPVFFLTMTGNVGPSITVKGEQKKDDAEISVKWSSKLMKNVNDRQVNSKVMDQAEIDAFKNAARIHLAAEPKKLLVLNEANIVWVKMPFVVGLTDADVWKKDAKGNYMVLPSDLKTMIKRFTDANVWKELGKVIAVDLFNGNTDRFSADKGDWVNKGNVMFQNQNGAIKVIGLDTFDPNGASNLTKQGDLKSLDILKSTNAMTDFAAKAIRSVEMEITDAMRKAKVTFTVACNNQPVKIDEHSEGFLDGYVGDLVQGLQQGASDLKAYLQGKKRQYGVAPAPLPPRGQAPVMGGHRGAAPAPPRPVMGGHRAAPVAPRVMPPLPAVPAPPAPTGAPGKTIPQGILDRMAYLGW